jgi:hypothetical protein
MSSRNEPSNPNSDPSDTTACNGTTTEPCPRCDATVTIGRVRRGNPYAPRNITTGGMPDSVPPSKTYEVEVTVTWSRPACPGQHIALSIINGSADNGTATVSPAQITATSVVTVTGGNQTNPGHAGNLKIQAKLDGTTVKAESAGFTVCAHPLNWRDTLLTDINTPTGVGIRVRDDWDSDSGTFGDLDETEIAEVIQLGPVTSPPFAPLAAQPLHTSSYLPGDQRSVDTLQEPRPAAGPAATLLTKQLSIFKCKRCGATDKDQPNSGMEHSDEVFQVGANWFHRTRRIGAAVTAGGHTSQAASVNITSSNHALP